MSPEDQRYFDEARSMFMSTGWSNFIAEVEVWLSGVSLDTCSTSDDFWMSKGALNALRRVLAYEALVKQAEEQADNESAA